MGGDTFDREEDLDDIPEPRRLRQLRWLVNALTLTLIAGFLTIVITLVLRLSAGPAAPALPGTLAVPPGEAVRAVTMGTGWIAVVTADGAGAETIRVFDATTGAERGSLRVPEAR